MSSIAVRGEAYRMFYEIEWTVIESNLMTSPHISIFRCYAAHSIFWREASQTNRPAPQVNLLPSQCPCITKSTPTPSFGNRFTTICGSNIPNGSSQMVNAPWVILTRRALWNCSTLRHEADPTNRSLLSTARLNRDWPESALRRSSRRTRSQLALPA